MVDFKQLLGAIDDLEAKGIARETTIEALKTSFAAPFKTGEYKDTMVEVNLDLVKGDIEVFILKDVVADDSAEDFNDNTMVPVDELEDYEEGKGLKVGDQLRLKQDLNEFTPKEIKYVRETFAAKIKEAERALMQAQYEDKKDEILVGEVEKVEPQFTIVNFNNKATGTLFNKQMIGDEQFQTGQTIKVYLQGISSDKGAPTLKITRSNPEFVVRLMEEEIHEIYDGTVVVKNASRNAGERTKVSVISVDPNVDPVGSCIGPGGTKISKVTGQLGKEKIDVIEYHEFPGLYIAEALKPGEVLGVALPKYEDGQEPEHKEATAVVDKENLRVTIGKRGINVFLASKLTGWKINVIDSEQAAAQGLEYMTVAEMKPIDEKLINAKRREYLLEQSRKEQEENLKLYEDLKAVHEAQAAERVDEEEYDYEVEAEVNAAAPLPEDVEETVEEEKVTEEPVVEEKFEDIKVEIKEPSKPVVSLAELEKQIEQEKKKASQPAKKSYKKAEEKPAEEKPEEKKPVVKPAENTMPIYSDEELEEIEAEEDYDDNKYDDDIDYSEYDSYYDEN